MVLLGIIGAFCTRLLMSQSRFFDATAAQRSARSVARTSMNLLLSELRMVEDSSSASGGIRAVANTGKSITVRVPYSFGLVCGVSASATTAMMLPVDSAMAATTKYKGYGWRAADGGYTYFTPSLPLGADSILPNPSSNVCTAAQIRGVNIRGRASRIVELKPPAVGVLAGTPLFVFQEVTYSFAGSTVYPGRIALWRQANGGSADELMAPFDTSARFRFFVRGVDTSRVLPPVITDSIVGLDLVLNGMSSRTAAGKSAPANTRMITSVFFKNRRAP